MMSAKYYVYAGGRWCEVETRRGRVSGWRARARFFFARGERLHAARAGPLLRGLRALAAGAPGAVRDAAPLPERPHAHRTRRDSRHRSRARRDSCAHTHAHHCCAHSHSRCDVNANELGKPPPAAPLPAKRRRISSDETNEPIPKSPLKQSQKSLKKSREQIADSDVEVQTVIPLKQGQACLQMSRKRVVDVRSASGDEVRTVFPLKQSQVSPQKSQVSPQKSRKRVVDATSSDDEVQTVVPLKQSQVSPQKSQVSPQKSRKRVVDATSSDDEVETVVPLKQSQVSPQKSRKRVVDATSSDDEVETVVPLKQSQVSPQKSRKRVVGVRSSIDEKVQKVVPLKQSQVSPQKSQVSPQKPRKQVVDVASTSDDEVQTVQKPDKPIKTRSSQQNIDVVIVRKSAAISDEDGTPQSVKGAERKRIGGKGVAINDVKDKEPRPVKGNEGKRNVISISNSSCEEVARSPILQKNKQRTRKHTKTEKFVEHLLESSESEEKPTAQARDESERCKELVIEESDVELLRKFLATKGGGDIARFDEDERYKLRVFHRLNPLVTLQRCQPLENLLRQRLTLKEFARNLGLRSVAEVTPEKRYRMRRSTKNARTASESDTDKENVAKVAKPKRRRLWNNDKELFNVRESQSSELRKKPQIPKPVARDSSRETSDSDTEFKRRVREQLESKERERSARRPTRSSGGSRALKEQNAESFKSKDRVEDKEKPSLIANRNNTETKTKEQSKPSDNTKSPRVKRHSSDGLPNRQTRSSLKRVASPVKPKRIVGDMESVDMKMKLARVSRSADSSEWEVVSRHTKSSSDVPAKNQDKSDSDRAFERKTSPKKDNLIRKAKPVKTQAQVTHPKDSGSKASEKDGRASEKKSAVVASMTVKPLKLKKSSVPPGREYTSLEDHAIIAWVCGGGGERARRVNGNRLWRELAQEYHRITGQSRTWHSLRNRYLRYLLPSLGALALPPAQVSRLRAAAATGEIKSRGATRQRRNSIFESAAVRSASAPHRHREREERREPEEREEQGERGGERKEVTLARRKGRWISAKKSEKLRVPEQAPPPRLTRSSLASPRAGPNTGRTR